MKLVGLISTALSHHGPPTPQGEVAEARARLHGAQAEAQELRERLEEAQETAKEELEVGLSALPTL